MSDMPERIWADIDGDWWAEEPDFGREYIRIDTHNRLEAQYEAAMKENREFEAMVQQLQAQLNISATTNTQRCGRCHRANFFDGEEFKCWNCGLEHTE